MLLATTSVAKLVVLMWMYVGVDSPWWYYPFQIQPTDDRKDETHNHLEPYHPNVCVLDDNSNELIMCSVVHCRR